MKSAPVTMNQMMTSCISWEAKMGPPNHHHGLADSISHTNRAHMARDALKLKRAAE